MRITGTATAAVISFKYSSLPRNQCGSVKQEIQSAPASSYSFAIARYGKSDAIRPFDGLAFLTSQINEIPSFRSAFSNSKLPLGIASASVLTDSSGFSAILFSYLFLVKSAISFNIVLLICYPDKFLKLSCRLAAVYYILCLLHCICKRYFALSRNVNTCTCIKYNCCTLSSS